MEIRGYPPDLSRHDWYAASVADLQKRGGYTPRRVRERRAYRLIQLGGVTGIAGVIGLVLAIAGAIGAGLPIVLLIVSIICVVMFRGMTGSR
jgi:hypothetical protein